MTKLPLLNAYLTERLGAVVKEILDVVEDTVTEYREEAARTRRENESLRRQLRDILLLEAETEWLSKGRAVGLAPLRTALRTASSRSSHGGSTPVTGGGSTPVTGGGSTGTRWWFPPFDQHLLETLTDLSGGVALPLTSAFPTSPYRRAAAGFRPGEKHRRCLVDRRALRRIQV